jgi:putative methyltransferase (TIGR04325 family)
MFAPIVLFVYNRPWHTWQALEALSKNILADQSILYIYADGIKPNATPTQAEALKQVRSIIREKQWCKEVRIIENEQNKGLANAIIAGVTETVNRYQKIIVLEDDMITSPYFLKYMNEALDFYEYEEKVASIHAYIYEIQGLPQTFFLKDPGCWGWATWQRAWKLFEADGEKLRQEIVQKDLVNRFDYEGSYPYFQMLEQQIKGKQDSWAIRWYASLFLKNKLSLYPHQSLVYNIGNDASGTNTITYESYFHAPVVQQAIDIQTIPIVENKEAYQKIVNFWRQVFPALSLSIRLKNKLKSIIANTRTFQLLRSKLFKIKNIENEDTFWRGNYASWEEVLAITQGYDDTASFEQIKNAALKVKRKEAIFERDGKLFYVPQYHWALIHFFKKISPNTLNIIDFGGALGSTYFQHQWLLRELESVSWNIVEQPHFVAFGQKELSDEVLHFYPTIEQAKQESKANAILLSGVLSYLPSPYQLLEMIKKLDFQYIIIDRTPFISEQIDILTMQFVNQKTLYQGSYPCWVLSEEKVKNLLLDQYELIEESMSFDWVPTKVDGLPTQYENFKSWFLKKK